jgi:uncharacterized membrane protein
VVDSGSVFLLYGILRREGLFIPSRLLLYLLAPATIIISGHHGNTDTVMIFFVLLVVYLLVSDRPTWLAGLALGMALSIKIVPVIFIPAFLFYLPTNRKRLELMAGAASMFLVVSIPYIFQHPLLITREVLGYRGSPGRWGLSIPLYAYFQGGPIFTVSLSVLTVALLALIVWFAYQNNRKNKVPLVLQLGLTVFAFISFTPAWGTNYMAWLDPFAAALGVFPALLYYLASGVLLHFLYFIRDGDSTRLRGMCWIAVLVVTWLFIRRIKQEKHSRS